MQKRKSNTIERRSSSRLKPRVYLFLELSIYIAIGSFIIVYMGEKGGLPLALLFVAGLIYKTGTFKRYEKIIERTKVLRKEELIVQYNLKEEERRS